MSSPAALPARRPRRAALIGTSAALAVILTWAALLASLLSRPGAPFAWWTPLAVAAVTFLYTGLFIVAHDAMHGSVAPGWPAVNRGIGQLALLLYALFPLSGLQKAHMVHHRAPATAEDPDHTGGEPLGFVRWYLRFMSQYLKVYQVVGMALLFNLGYRVAGIPQVTLVTYWVVPALLSTLQLFYFGTYLPHRVPRGGHADHHAAVSSGWPPWLSFITCYHFGYHWEHHQFPTVPWWRLPKFRRCG